MVFESFSRSGIEHAAQSHEKYEQFCGGDFDKRIGEILSSEATLSKQFLDRYNSLKQSVSRSVTQDPQLALWELNIFDP